MASDQKSYLELTFTVKYKNSTYMHFENDLHAQGESKQQSPQICAKLNAL